MKKAILLLCSLGMVGTAVANDFGQSNPDWTSLEDHWRGGSPTVLKLSTQDVNHTFDGSAVEIPFTIEGVPTAMVYLAVYTLDANPQYGGEPFGVGGIEQSLIRAAGLDTLVYISPGERFDAGSNTISWDGTDYNGSQVGPGAYRTYLFAIDVDSPPTYAGGTMAPWQNSVVDDTKSPPEIWFPQQLDGVWHIRMSEMGTDLIANPEAFETFAIPWVNAVPGETGNDWKDVGYIQMDPAEDDVAYVIRFQNPPGGLYRAIIDREAGTALLDESWENADGGYIAMEVRGITTMVTNARHHPWVADDGMLYATVADHVEPYGSPGPAVQIFDRATGELVEILSFLDFFPQVFNDEGAPRNFKAVAGFDVDDTGYYGTSYLGRAGAGPTKTDKDLNLVWKNQNGDFYLDYYTREEREALGIPSNIPISILASRWGISFVGGWEAPEWATVLGPDGFGLFKLNLGIHMPRSALGGIAMLMDNDNEADGLYIGVGSGPLPGTLPHGHRPGEGGRGSDHGRPGDRGGGNARRLRAERCLPEPLQPRDDRPHRRSRARRVGDPDRAQRGRPGSGKTRGRGPGSRLLPRHLGRHGFPGRQGRQRRLRLPDGGREFCREQACNPAQVSGQRASLFRAA